MPTQWVNFAEIRKRVSLKDVIVVYYGITTLTAVGEAKLVGPCPIHNGDSPRAFHADLEKNVWHCFSRCKGGGNQLDFVAKKEGISIREAALKLQAFFLVVEGDDRRPTPPASAKPTGKPPPSASPPGRSSSSKGTPPANLLANGVVEDEDDETTQPSGKSAPVPEKNPPLDLTLNLKAEHPHLTHDRDLQLDTIKHFGIGYCSAGIMRGMIAIPIHDEGGALIAYAGRRLKHSDIEQYGKYKLPKGFRKEVVLFNYHRAKETIGEKGFIVVEGFFSVFKLREAGFENVVATMGCEVSTFQVELLRHAKEAIVLFDGNDAGRGGAEKLHEQLSPHIPVRLAKLPEGMQPDDLSPRALRWLISGMQVLDFAEVSFRMAPK